MDGSNSAGRYCVIACGAVALAFLVTRGLNGGGGPAVGQPRVQWQTADGASLEPFQSVDPETPIRATLELTATSWVYVAAFDPTRGALALRPSTELLSDVPGNPIPAGTHTLPGRHIDKDLFWHTSDAHGPLSFLIVVSEQPLDELEKAMPSWRQVGNRAFPQRPLLGTYAPRDGMEATPPRTELPTAAFQAAHGLQHLTHDGPMSSIGDGVHASALRVQVDARDAAQRDVRDVARDKLGDLLTPEPPK